MERLARVFALAFAATTLVAGPSLAQSPRPRDDAPAIFDRQERPTSKSDAFRVVGRVVEIDRHAGTIKLQTEEGTVMTKPRPELLQAVRVGDTISVARPGSDAPSASPRTR